MLLTVSLFFSLNQERDEASGAFTRPCYLCIREDAILRVDSVTDVSVLLFFC